MEIRTARQADGGCLFHPYSSGMERILRVLGVLATCTFLYFTIPFVVHAVDGVALPQWFRDFWHWTQPFRFVLFAGLIALSIVGAAIRAPKSDDVDGAER